MRQRRLDYQRSDLPHGVSGAADPNFACAVRSFAALFPSRRFGGGALAVYLDGKPVVDVWTGWSDRRGRVPWSADTGAMVFSATKGMASTVIHRLVDRGLIDYESPVAEFWPEFGANGKSAITVRELMAHRAGLTHLHGASREELLDPVAMEARLASAAPGPEFGKAAYHALTYGWLMSGLARSVTGKGMRELFHQELAEPLDSGGLHLGRPPAEASTRAAEIVMPQGGVDIPVLGALVPRIAGWPGSRALGSMYFPGVISFVQGDMPFLDTEAPAVNGVATARGLARLYGAIANGGEIDGARFLSPGLVADLTGRPSLRPDANLGIPMSFHLGYHAVPIPGVLPGFGHVGLGGSLGWADPASGLAIGFVHNRLLTRFVLADHVGFVGIGNLIRRAAAAGRRRGIESVPDFGAPVGEAGEATG